MLMILWICRCSSVADEPCIYGCSVVLIGKVLVFLHWCSRFLTWRKHPFWGEVETLVFNACSILGISAETADQLVLIVLGLGYGPRTVIWGRRFLSPAIFGLSLWTMLFAFLFSLSFKRGCIINPEIIIHPSCSILDVPYQILEVSWLLVSLFLCYKEEYSFATSSNTAS